MSGVALFGAGYMAGVHARAWAEASTAVAVVCSPSTRGRELAAGIGARWTPSLDDALGDPAVTIVDICTPTPTHPSLIEAGIRGGKHVLVEKPIALDEAGLVRACQAWRQRSPGQILMVAHVLQFFAGYDRIIQSVDDGAIGVPSSLVATRFGEKPSWSTWITDESASGGPLVDLLIHDFDIANRLLGTPVSVRARESRGSYAVTVAYQDGSTALVAGGSDLPAGTPFSSSVQVTGAQGILSHRFAAASADAASPDLDVDWLTASGHERLDGTGEEPFVRQARYFLSCVETGREPVIGSVGSAVMALEVSLAAARSLASGREEDLGDGICRYDSEKSTKEFD
jgi:predicted dehydrogenase